MAGRVISYSYSEGVAPVAIPPTAAPATARLESTQTIAVIEQTTPGTTTRARTSAPTDFLTQLSTWATQLTLAAPAGAPAGIYALSYSATTKRVTIATTNATAFRPVMPGNLALYLGFTQDLSGAAGWATSWTGASQPMGILEALGLEMAPVEDAARVELHQWRHDRSQAITWGNHQLVHVRLWVRDADVATLEAGWCVTGRLLLYLPGSVGAYSATNPGGYVDGYVVNSTEILSYGSDEGIVTMDLLVAVSR